MTYEEKRKMIRQLLLFVYQEWNKPITEEIISLWLDNLKGHSLPNAKLAAKYVLQQKSYGEPKLGDFMDALRRIETYKPHDRYNPWGPAVDPPHDSEIGKFLSNCKTIKQLGNYGKKNRDCKHLECQNKSL